MNVVAVVGLAYEGLPLAVKFGKKIETVGFDLSIDEIEGYKGFCGPAGEMNPEDLKFSPKLTVTTVPAFPRKADYIVVAAPTPGR